MLQNNIQYKTTMIVSCYYLLTRIKGVLSYNICIAI